MTFYLFCWLCETIWLQQHYCVTHSGSMSERNVDMRSATGANPFTRQISHPKAAPSQSLHCTTETLKACEMHEIWAIKENKLDSSGVSLFIQLQNCPPNFPKFKIVKMLFSQISKNKTYKRIRPFELFAVATRFLQCSRIKPAQVFPLLEVSLKRQEGRERQKKKKERKDEQYHVWTIR